MGVRAIEQIENLTAVGLGCALLSCIHRMTPGKESSYGVVLFQNDKTNVFHDSRDELMDFQNSGVFCNLHMTAHSILPDIKRRDLLNNRLRP